MSHALGVLGCPEAAWENQWVWPGPAWVPWGAQKHFQTAAKAIFGGGPTVFSFPPQSAQPRDSKKGLSDFLAFLTPTQNYFELDCVFSSHP